MSALDDTEIAENVALAHRISAWLRSAGVVHTEMGVDLADIIYGARSAERLILAMLELDVSKPAEADLAESHLGHLDALLLTDMKYHLSDLQETSPELWTRLGVCRGDSESADE